MFQIHLIFNFCYPFQHPDTAYVDVEADEARVEVYKGDNMASLFVKVIRAYPTPDMTWHKENRIIMSDGSKYTIRYLIENNICSNYISFEAPFVVLYKR